MLGNPAQIPPKPGDCTHGLFFTHHFYSHHEHDVQKKTSGAGKCSCTVFYQIVIAGSDRKVNGVWRFDGAF